MPPSPRLIVFDFDGVIVDSEPMHESALLAAAQSLGMSFTHDQYINHYLGFDDRDTWLAIAKDNHRTLSDADTAHLNTLKKTAVDRAIARGEPSPFRGSVELVRAAAARGPIALCSGARRHEITPILERLGLINLFQTLVTADDVARAKPDPMGYALTASRLGFAPNRERGLAPIAIEDTPKGARAARSAGYRVVAVRHSLKNDPFADADLILDSLATCTVDRILSA